MPAACARGAYRLPGTGLLRSPPESRSASTLPPAVRRLRRRRHVATGVVSRALESWPARTQGIRWREEVLFVLRASKLAVGWIVGLNALPALRPHAPAIDLFRHVVFARRLLNALPAVGPEVGDRAARCLPVMTAAADEKAKSQYQRDQPEQDHPVPLFVRRAGCLAVYGAVPQRGHWHVVLPPRDHRLGDVERLGELFDRQKLAQQHGPPPPAKGCRGSRG